MKTLEKMEIQIKNEYYQQDSTFGVKSVFATDIQKKLKTFVRKVLKHGFNLRDCTGKLPVFSYILKLPITQKRIGFIVTVNGNKSARVFKLSSDDMLYVYDEEDTFINNIMESLVYDDKLSYGDEEDSYERRGVSYSFSIEKIEEVDEFIVNFQETIKRSLEDLKETLRDELANYKRLCVLTGVDPEINELSSELLDGDIT